MRLVAMMLIALGLAGSPAMAQDTTATPGDVMSSSSAGGSAGGMGELLAKGYEIRTAVANGTHYIVFLQKDQSAYACEFVTLTKSRCGSIN